MGIDIRRATLRLWLYTIGANAAVVGAFFIGALSWRTALMPQVELAMLMRISGTFGAAYFVIGSAHAYLVSVRKVRACTRWVAEDRPATEGEQRLIAELPRRQGRLSMLHWVVVVPLGIPLMQRLLDIPFNLEFLVKLLGAWALLAFAAAMLTYFVSEYAMSDVRGRAMAGRFAIGGVGAMGMRTRLLLAWLGSAALPLAAICVFYTGTTVDERARSVGVIWTTTLIGLTAGLMVTLFAIRTIIRPVTAVRAGMRRLAEGDLDVRIEVDDATELGLLQAGFNEMVDGLLDRERMRDLFGRHVGAEVVRRAMSGDGALGGERRVVTTLFVDVIASSNLAATKEPEDVVGLLNAFFDAVVRAVRAEGGLVNKFEGDGAMAIFGAPTDQVDHDIRALRAACALRQEIVRMPDGFDAAIGVSSGVVVAGNIGSADRYEYTVIGDPVNEASRLCDAAKSVPSKVLASERTASGAYGWQEAGLFALRGRSEPTLAFAPELTQTSI